MMYTDKNWKLKQMTDGRKTKRSVKFVLMKRDDEVSDEEPPRGYGYGIGYSGRKNKSRQSKEEDCINPGVTCGYPYNVSRVGCPVGTPIGVGVGFGSVVGYGGGVGDGGVGNVMSCFENGVDYAKCFGVDVSGTGTGHEKDKGRIKTAVFALAQMKEEVENLGTENVERLGLKGSHGIARDDIEGHVSSEDGGEIDNTEKDDDLCGFDPHHTDAVPVCDDYRTNDHDLLDDMEDKKKR
eukprot:TRINITY_DN10857_c0_g2_i3.p1 TRINITY_DN10857_c0_g2~~TRINITY_DN10857_c0_g2_i3.p1  ORF type:complete len:238 (-),score=86.71 TRINITY_DN10857_c0_g2_i3:134-847(-)